MINSKTMQNTQLLIFSILFMVSTSLNAQINRTLDGTSNNVNNPNWGSANIVLKRISPVSYSDGISQIGGTNRPNPRTISNNLSAQNTGIPNELGLSDFVWGWGQFIDHDIALSDIGNESANISVPACDADFDPSCLGTVEIPLRRSIYAPSTGTSVNNPRQQVNILTAYIDASGVYGTDDSRVQWIRSGIKGKLRTSAGNLMPFNTISGDYNLPVDPNAPAMIIDVPNVNKYYIGGDMRVNEQPGLTSFHTLFMREHNRLCDEFTAQNPNWTDEELFQRARKMVGAYIQAVTYEEFLPSIGVILGDYTGYDHNVQPDLMNVFTSAGYRFGHTMINQELLRLEENGDISLFGNVNLMNAFFNPMIIKNEGGIEPFFRGMGVQKHQMVDTKIMNDLRNFLFGIPGSGGLDLVCLNLQRAREHGVSDYNKVRISLGLVPITAFSQITSNLALVQALKTTYNDNVNIVDPWIGFMAEEHLPDALMGETLNKLLKLQFQSLRDGDRFFYQNDPSLSIQEKIAIKSTHLSDIILRNTSIQTIQQNVFIAHPRETVGVSDIYSNNVKLEVYPNPVRNYFKLSVHSGDAMESDVFIINSIGQIIHEEKISLQSGKNTFEIKLGTNLPNGFYTLALDSNGNKYYVRIVKQ